MIDEVTTPKKPACEDCGLFYGDEHGFPDLLVSNETWEKLMPGRQGSGLLCPNCMCKRGHALGIWASAIFVSGPFRNPTGLLREYRTH